MAKGNASMNGLPPRLSDCDPETIAIGALQFLAGRPEELARFLMLSGIDPGGLRRLAGHTDFLAGILDFLLADEALLLTFASETDLAPEQIAIARRRFEHGPRPLDAGEE